MWRKRSSMRYESRRIPTQRIRENRKGTARRLANLQDDPNTGTKLAKDEPHQRRARKRWKIKGKRRAMLVDHPLFT